MEFEFGILGDLELSEDEHPSFQIATRAYELEMRKQQDTSFAAWKGDTAGHLKHFLDDIICELQPSECDYLLRLDVISRLSTIVNSLEGFIGATISAFGSFESNCYTRWADLDLSLELPETNDLPGPISKTRKVKALRSLMRVLLKSAEAHKLQFIPHARVPLLTFEDSRSNISCDISVHNGLAILKSRLLRWISYMDPRCRDLIFLVKCWAKAHCINDPKMGTLNSFALSLLVVFHLQTRSPPVLPPLNAVLHEDIARKLSGMNSQISREQLLKSCWERIQPFVNKEFGLQNKSSVAELFVSFFDQFSSVAGLWLQGLAVCTYTGKWGDKSSTCKQWRSKHYVMAVEDPFDRWENCARSVQQHTFPGVLRAFTSTSEALYHRSPSVGFPSLLGILFCWPIGTQEPSIKVWLSKLYTREGKIGWVKALKPTPGEHSRSGKFVATRQQRPTQKVKTYPHSNGIANEASNRMDKSSCHDSQIRGPKTCKIHRESLPNNIESLETNKAGITTTSEVVQNQSEGHLDNSLNQWKGKGRWRKTNPRRKGSGRLENISTSICDSLDHQLSAVSFEEKDCTSHSIASSKPEDGTVQGKMCRPSGNSLSSVQCHLEDKTRMFVSERSEAYMVGPQITSEFVDSQRDIRRDSTVKNFVNRNSYQSRWRRSKHEGLFLSGTADIPFERRHTANNTAALLPAGGYGQGVQDRCKKPNQYFHGAKKWTEKGSEQVSSRIT